MSGSDNLNLVVPPPTTSPGIGVPVGTARALKVLFVLCLAIHAVAVWSDAAQLLLLMGAQDGATIPDVVADAHDRRHALIGIAQAALALPTWILFLVWTYRVNASLRRLGTKDMSFTPGWAVGWHFVPIANLWKPFCVMREIWAASEHTSDDWEDQPVSCVVGLWWAFWLMSFISGRVATKLTLRAEELDEMLNATYLMLCADAMDIPHYLAAFALVSAVTAMQLRRTTRDPLA